jgi:DHA2 family multidrug resistance protein
MMLFGRIGNRVSPRVLITIGALLTSLTGICLMDLNPDTGTSQLFWPLVLRGLGSVFIFMPLSIATLGPLAKKDLAAGAGLYSLTRQLGSSIGIALITTLLARREAAHRSVLVERISDFHPANAERLQLFSGFFSSHGADAVHAKAQAMKLIDLTVSSQATILSYEDLFVAVAGLFLLSLPLILLLGGKGGKAAEEAAAAAH